MSRSLRENSFLSVNVAAGSRMVSWCSKANVFLWRNLLTDNCLFSSVNSSWGWVKRLPDHTIQQLYVACLVPKCWVGDQAEGEQKPETVMLQTVVLWGCKNNTARWGQALSLAIKTCTEKEDPKASYISCGCRKEHWNHNEYIRDGSQTIWKMKTLKAKDCCIKNQSFFFLSSSSAPSPHPHQIDGHFQYYLQVLFFFCSTTMVEKTPAKETCLWFSCDFSSPLLLMKGSDWKRNSSSACSHALLTNTS